MEYRFRDRTTGGYRWFLGRALPARDATGQIIKWFGTCTDIDEQKRTEEALRRSETRARRLMDSNVVGVAIGDADAVMEANDAFLRILGCNHEDLTAGRIYWGGLIPPDYAFLEERAHRELRETGECAPYETEYIRKDGSRVPVLIGGATVEREPWQAVYFVLDMTNQQDIEQQRETFLSGIMHDLRTPLTTIKGSAQFLERLARRGDSADAARLLPRIAAIDDASMRMMEMITELLDVSRIRAGRPLDLERAPTDLVALTKAVVARYGAHTGNCPVDLTSDAATLTGDWDAHRIERVVENLLSNACKFSPHGGAVRVALSREGENDKACAVLTVADNGIGIPAADLPHIFERFYRAANVVGVIAGMGIGLAGVRQIVEQHGGTAIIDSVEGQGTRITIRLPLAA